MDPPVNVPKLTEVFQLREMAGDPFKEFKKRLGNLIGRNKGKVPLTHATSERNWKAIQAAGKIHGNESSGGREMAGAGVFFHLGFVSASDWTPDDKEGDVLLYVELPSSEKNSIVPDPNLYGSSDVDEEGYADFIETADRVGTSNLVGMEVFRPGDLPVSYVKSVKGLRKTGAVNR